MKNVNVIFAAILFALFTLTSCEKEGMTELTNASPNMEITTERNIPDGGINIVNKDAVTMATKATLTEQATARSRDIKWVDAKGAHFHDSTVGEGNSLDRAYYPSCADQTGESFAGDDRIYYLEIDRDMAGNHITHHISITDLSDDLDLFLFALDRYGYIADCKGISITEGYDDESIEVSGLNEGAYIVVVDGYDRGVAGSYNFTKSYSAVSPNPPVNPGPDRPGGPINPQNGGQQDMTNARFIDFLGGEAGLTGNGWMVTRNGQSQIFEDYEATATTLTLMSRTYENGKTIDTTITFDKTAKWVTSKTEWRSQYAAGSSSWSASIRDIDYAD